MTVLVTGGAGFIGSHLIRTLIERGSPVRVLDNLSSGSIKNVERWSEEKNYNFFEGDLTEPNQVQAALKECDIVYHLAANPEVRSWRASQEDHFRQNIEATFNLLEAIKENGGVNLLIFTSTSTVYGDAELIPTPETYAPLKPISSYGASKLAAEALICSYASMFNFRCVIFRMANIVGLNSGHGVIYDFIEKLNNDPSRLEVLGDGTQSKSYLHVDDCIEGIILGTKTSKNKVEILNIGSEDKISVLEIAKIVIKEMGLKDTKIKLTGGVDGGRGWKGDVKTMQLDMSRLRALGWKPNYKSYEAVRKTVRELITNFTRANVST